MRRFVTAGLTLVAALALTTAPAQAQFFVGAGLTLPSGDFDNYKAGLGVSAGVAVIKSADERMKVWAEGFYGMNKFDNDAVDVSATLMGAYGSATYDLMAEGSAIPYLIGGAGYMTIKVEDADREGGFGFFGGAGVSFGKLWLEGRYSSASIEDATLSFLGVMVGYSF
jgi:hypothetical protein